MPDRHTHTCTVARTWCRKSCVSAALLAALVFLSGCADSTPGACRLAPRTQEPVWRFVLSSRVHYLQRDRRWAADPIGGSEKPLGAVGCTVCCLSMALAQHGIE